MKYTLSLVMFFLCFQQTFAEAPPDDIPQMQLPITASMTEEEIISQAEAILEKYAQENGLEIPEDEEEKYHFITEFTKKAYSKRRTHDDGNIVGEYMRLTIPEWKKYVPDVNMAEAHAKYEADILEKGERILREYAQKHDIEWTDDLKTDRDFILQVEISLILEGMQAYINEKDIPFPVENLEDLFMAGDDTELFEVWAEKYSRENGILLEEALTKRKDFDDEVMDFLEESPAFQDSKALYFYEEIAIRIPISEIEGHTPQPVIDVDVIAQDSSPVSWWQKIESFLRRIFTFFKNLFS